MDPTIDIALDIIEGMYASYDAFWMIFDYDLNKVILEEHGILLDGRIAIEKDEIEKARHGPMSKAWYDLS